MTTHLQEIATDNEVGRLSTLKSYSILHTVPESSFDRITRILSTSLDVPMAFITFIEEDSIWFKSALGEEIVSCARAGAFCDQTIRQDTPFVVEDALLDSRFVQNPFVNDPAGIRFYAGAPLRSPNGFNLGTLCVFDLKPRKLNAAQLSLLTDMAALVIDELELRRRMSQAVSFGEERIRDFARSTSDWFWETNEKLRFSYFSERMTEIVGIPQSEVLGKTRQETNIENYADADEYQQHLQDLADHKPFRNFVHGRQQKDGSIKWFAISGFPRFDHNGVFQGYRGSGADITEKVNAEEALRIADKQARQSQKMEAVGRLTGGVAHDFNNLLAIVIGNLELAIASRLSEDKKLACLKNALRVSNKGADLIQRLLAFSRQQELKPEALNLNDIILGMTDMLDRMIGEEIRVQTKLSQNLWLAKTDEAQFEAAILNLALNAQYAMKSGGVFSITTENKSLSLRESTEIGLEIPGDYIAVTVSDTGMGIPEEIIDQVLEPFFSTKDVGEGSGLGLSMVHGFMSQIGGTISIQSEVGAGTRVYLHFPAAGSRQFQSLPDRRDAGKAVCKKGTILVVEDNIDLLEVTKESLLDLGYEIYVATDGPTALAILQDRTIKIDLLFTDIILPNGMTGIDLGKKALARQPNIKILYTSGYSKKANQKGQQDLRADVDTMPKPYSRRQLGARLESLFGEPVASRH